MLILNFSLDSCIDCHRPPNAGGYHNVGCKLNHRRLCPLCQHPHSEGDDVHRDLSGAYCSYQRTIDAKIEAWPGWTADRCREHVDQLMAGMQLELDVYELIKANPLMKDIILAAVRGARD